MKFILGIAAALGVALGVSSRLTQPSESDSRNTLAAPTYYVSAEVSDCEPDPNYIAFRGASNLPPGSLIAANVAGFDFDAWKYYGDYVYVPVDDQGLFDGKITPKAGMKVGHNLMLVLDFTTYRPKQSPSVLRVVGMKGELLGGVSPVPITDVSGRSRNPQLFQVSGWYYGLHEIARIPNCGERQ